VRNAWEQATQEFKCAHDETTLRYRTASNGVHRADREPRRICGHHEGLWLQEEDRRRQSLLVRYRPDDRLGPERRKITCIQLAKIASPAKELGGNL
jgi:hypothetical protein